ncbi:MAG: fumarylacetoacetate hydrolase family protein [Solirubrobacteraceae bacterium]
MRVGIVEDDTVVDLVAGIAEVGQAAAIFANECAVLSSRATGGDRNALADVQLLAPVTPRKFFAIGLNYADHIEEADLERPTVPMFFNKQPTSVIGTGAAIERPVASDKLDYEGELGVVIGRRCRHIPRELAPQVVAGFVIVNDVSVRDWQAASPTITLGKSWDTHGPLGPWLTTADAIADPHDLELRTYVNDELRQRSSTGHLVFDCYDQIAHLSTVCTLEPGDVIATGTPSGVGVLMDPPAFMQPGDTVRIEIDGLGVLENHVVQEPSDRPWIGDANGVELCAG